MRWLDGITDSMGHEFKQAPGDDEGQGSLACSSPWGWTQLSDWTRVKGGGWGHPEFNMTVNDKNHSAHNL